MTQQQRISASLEDYLETILHVIEENGEARSKVVMERMEVTAASVTEAFQLLDEKGLAVYRPYEPIQLTEAGKNLALDVIYRHETLRDFFLNVLRVDEDIADQGACKMEHVVSEEIIERMIKYSQYISKQSVSDNMKQYESFDGFILEKNS